MKNTKRLLVGLLLAGGTIAGLENPASANQVWVTYSNMTVGAGNGGQTPGAANDGWYQAYAAYNTNYGLCAITQFAYTGSAGHGAGGSDWIDEADDCTNNGVGNATLVYTGTNAAYVRSCVFWDDGQDGAVTCGTAQLLLDDGT